MQRQLLFPPTEKHILHGLLGGDDAGDAEEGALEDGVGPSAEADFRRNLRRVDNIKVDLLATDDRLGVVRDALEGLFLIPE